MESKNSIQTTIIGEHTVIVTENVNGEMYLIKARHFQDILDDWEGECEFVPANDAREFFASCNGRPVDPYSYTDFESLLIYLKECLACNHDVANITAFGIKKIKTQKKRRKISWHAV